MPRALLLFVAGCNSAPTLYVELKTDLRAGVEIDRVRISVAPHDPVEGFERAEEWTTIDEGDPLLDGHRVAELPGLPLGDLDLEANAYVGGEMLITQRLLVEFREQRVVTVRMVRACAGENPCPPVDSPNDTECIGEDLCVPPTCFEEAPETCPPPACTSGDCPARGECGVGVCLGGVCGVALSDDACPGGFVCARGERCIPAMTLDAGPCPMTAEVCNGADDDCDAAIDEVFSECPSVPFASAACDGSCTFTCDAGRADCNGNAADGCEASLDDGASCGSCDRQCSAPAPFCRDGACTSDCSLTMCGASCVDLTSDPAHCGSCNAICDPPGASGACVGGSCTIGACDAGRCDADGMGGNGCESAIGTDASCASCTDVCLANESCSGGACNCDAGFLDCNATPGCETPVSAANCGACGDACDSGETCAGGACRCGGSGPDCAGTAASTCCGTRCIDTRSSETDCGGCDVSCGSGESCSSGTCRCGGSGPDCADTPTSTCCGTSCVNTRTSESDCGGCDVTCGGGESCSSGTCRCGGSGPNCADTSSDSCCGTMCVDTTSDVDHCGTCAPCGANANECVGSGCRCSGAAPCGGSQVCRSCGCVPATETQCFSVTGDEDCDGQPNCADPDCDGAACRYSFPTDTTFYCAGGACP